MKRKPGDDGRDPVESKTLPRDLIARLALNDVKQVIDRGSPIDRAYALGDVEATLALFREQGEYGRSLFINSLRMIDTSLQFGVILAILRVYPQYRNDVKHSMIERDIEINTRQLPGRDPHASNVVALRLALEAEEEEYESIESWIRHKFDLAKQNDICPYPGTLRVMLDMVPALAAENKNVFKAKDLFPLYFRQGDEPKFLPNAITDMFASDVMYVSEKTFAWRTDLLHEVGNWEEFKESRIMCKRDPDMLNQADEAQTPIQNRDVSDCGLQLPDGKTKPFEHVIVNTGPNLAWMPENLVDGWVGDGTYTISNVPDRNQVLAYHSHSQERGDAMIQVRIPKLYVATAGTRGRMVHELRLVEIDGKMIQEEKKEDVGLVPTGVCVVDTENHRCFAFVASQQVQIGPSQANIPAGRRFADCVGQVASLDDAILFHFFNVDRVMIHRVEEALGIQYDHWARGGDPGAIQVAFDSVIRP